jgi:hypothetical protein
MHERRWLVKEKGMSSNCSGVTREERSRLCNRSGVLREDVAPLIQVKRGKKKKKKKKKKKRDRLG